jgi:hypothetical protein
MARYLDSLTHKAVVTTIVSRNMATIHYAAAVDDRYFADCAHAKSRGGHSTDEQFLIWYPGRSESYRVDSCSS